MDEGAFLRNLETGSPRPPSPILNLRSFLPLTRVRIREAAAVLVHRPGEAGEEFLLVERAPELRFFGGYWACPGGVLEPADSSAGEAGGAAARAAVRELFEELGHAPGLEPNESLREGVLAGEPEAVATVRARGRPVDLQPLGTLTTPAIAPVRYRTRFYSWRCPREPVIRRGELIDARFETPQDILDSWTRGARPVVPPVLLLCRLWIRHREFEAFAQAFAETTREFADGRFHPIYFVPGVRVLPLTTETLPPATTTNCILIGERHRYLVDPAVVDGDERDRLLAELEPHGSLAGVVLTHHHHDHVGGADALARELGLPVLAHPATLRRVRIDARRNPLNGGEKLALGTAPDGTRSWSLEVFHTPGHAPGHLAFREDRYGSWIAADLISTLSTIVLDPDEADLGLYRSSLRRLLAEADGVLHPSHGPAHLHSHEVVKAVLHHRNEREQAVLLQLQAGPASIAELTAAVYHDVDRSLHQLAARSMRTGLFTLEEQGVIVRAEDGRFALR